MGDYDGDHFDEPVLKTLLVLFVFVVTIILLNVLIAIVNEAYAEAQKEKAGIYYRLKIELIMETSAVVKFLPWCLRPKEIDEDVITEKLKDSLKEYKEQVAADDRTGTSVYLVFRATSAPVPPSLTVSVLVAPT